jgi:hypothetical protein
MLAISILSCVMIVVLATFQIPPLIKPLPIPTFNLFLVVGMLVIMYSMSVMAC